jgi:predicted RNase H-like HicB family nuclease
VTGNQANEQTNKGRFATQDFLVIVHTDEEGGFWTEVPALTGCGSQGETVEEAVEMTKDAIHGFLASMREYGETPPAERTVAVTVTVAA